jgi:arylsulfate sulfotransferase
MRVFFSLTALLLAAAIQCQALTIVSGPSFGKAANAPLSGVLQLTTDEASRVSISVNDGTEVWERAFYDFGTVHSVPLFGFKPGRTNEITVTVYDRFHNAVTSPQPLVFITDPLPGDFPNITLRQADQAQMEPGYTLFRVTVHNETYWYVVIVDSSGEVVWYNPTPSTADVRQLENGDLFLPSTNRFVEMNLLGETMNTWPVPDDLQIDPHEGLPTGHGTILYLSGAVETVTGYPTSVTIPNAPLATANVRYEKVVEISATNAAVLNTWAPIDVLDPRRISYLDGTYGPGWDSEHSNAIIEDPSDDSLIVSMRHQNAVIKISRATGQLQWILGPPERWGPQWQPYLLTPVGTPFAWQYGQHAPVLTAQGTLMLYDDGNYRAMPFAPQVPDANNYSRAVEYKIDEQTMEVSQVWEYGRTNAERLFTGLKGSADPLPKTGNVLMGFAAVSYVNGGPPSAYGPGATMVRIQEVSPTIPRRKSCSTLR